MVHFLRQYGYPLLFLTVLVENLGLPVPSYAFILVGAALAADLRFTLGGVVVASAMAALVGDGVWYILGRLRGRPILRTLCSVSLNPDSCVSRTENLFTRHGLKSLLVAKFLPGLNTVAPPLMGTLRARFGSFFAYDLGGALIFTVVSAGIGYVLGLEMVDRVQAAASQLGAFVGWGAAGFGLSYVGWRFVLRMRVRKALRSVGLTPDELRRRQEEGADLVVVDVRSPLAVKEKPRLIAGALRAGHEEIERLAATLSRHQTIVAYCV